MAWQTGSTMQRESIERPLWRGAPVTVALIAVTVTVHLAGVASPDLQAVLFEHGARLPAAVAAGDWHRLVTSAFLHSHDGALVVFHVLFNMLWVYILGRELEPRVGSAPFAALYLTTAVGGSAAAHLAGRGGVGASGAVYGLLGALFVEAVRSRNGPGGRQNLRGWLWLLGFGLSMPLWAGSMWGRIGWEAHLGGLAAGMLVGFCWAAMSSRTAEIRTGLAAGVGGLSFALVLSGAALPVDTVEAGWVPASSSSPLTLG